MPAEIRLLGPADADVLSRVAEGVFDGPVKPELASDFLADARHHLIVAVVDGTVVGMITALDYIHPDKARQLWINEVGVASAHRRLGVGQALLRAMLHHGRALGCTEAWLGTEHDNDAACGLYEKAGGNAAPFVLYSFDLSQPDHPPDTGFHESPG